MHRTPQEHRQEFQEQGYTVFEGVLSADETAYAQAVFDEVITPDTKPPIVYPTEDARRQMNKLHCEPRLSKFGHHPRVLEAMRRLFDRPFRLDHTPTPTALFQGKSAGLPGVPGKWWGHIDWPSKAAHAVGDQRLRLRHSPLHHARARRRMFHAGAAQSQARGELPGRSGYAAAHVPIPVPRLSRFRT